MSVISYLTTIRFADGAITGLAQDLDDLALTRPLIVTDRGLLATDLIERLLTAAPRLRQAPFFADVPGNPNEAAVLAALTVYRQGDCDGIIALGGGSPIDLAKAVALLATHPGPLASYAFVLGGLNRITPAVAPVIAIPTTAGTGSEVGRAALITLADDRKLAIISPHLIPKRAICDPQLTVGLPPLLTAATGMDAITHCVETYLSPRDNPVAEAIALDGLVRGVAHLQRAVHDGTDNRARREMMIAALHGGLTFQKGLGAVHALSHPLGAVPGLTLHHGMLNAVLLPHVVRFNTGSAPEKYAVLKQTLGLAPNADLAGFFHDLTHRLGLPVSLSAMRVPRAALAQVADGAVIDHSGATNPRQCDHADYLRLLAAAFD
jgi:4-hydroxybutyrate dehydrogenase